MQNLDLSFLDTSTEPKLNLGFLESPADKAAKVRTAQDTPINRGQAQAFPSMQERGVPTTTNEEDKTSWDRLTSLGGVWNAIKTGVGDLIQKPKLEDAPAIAKTLSGGMGGPANMVVDTAKKMWDEYGPGHLQNLDKVTLKDVLNAVTPKPQGYVPPAPDKTKDVYFEASPALARGEKKVGEAWQRGDKGTAITRQILNTIPVIGPMVGDFADNPDPSAFAGHILGATAGAALGEGVEGEGIPHAIERGIDTAAEVPSIALRGGKAVLSPIETTKNALGAVGDTIRPIKAVGIDKINEAAGVTPDNSLTMALRPKNTSLDFTRQAPVARALIAQSADEIGRPVTDIESMDVAKEHAISKLVDKQEELMKGKVRSHDGTPIATSIKDAVPELYRHENPGAAAAIDEWADNTYSRPLTDRQLNTFRKDANADNAGYNGKLPNQQMALDRKLDSAIKTAKSDAIRKLQIDSMNEFDGTGKGMQQVNGGLRSLLTVGDALDRRFNVVQRQALQNLPQQVSKMLAAGKFGKAALSLVRGDVLGAGMDALSGMGQVGLTDFMKELNSANGQIASAFRRTTERPPEIDMGVKAPAPETTPTSQFTEEQLARRAGIDRQGLNFYVNKGELVRNENGTYSLAPQGLIEKDPGTGQFRKKATPATGLGLPDTPYQPLTTGDLPQPGGQVSIERHPVTGQFQRKTAGTRYTDEAVRSQLGLSKPLSTYVNDGTLTKNFDGTYSVPEKSLAAPKPMVERDPMGRFRKIQEAPLTTSDLPTPDGAIKIERDPSTGRFRRKDAGVVSLESDVPQDENSSKMSSLFDANGRMLRRDAGMARLSEFGDGKFSSKLGKDIEDKSPASALAQHFMNIAEQSGGTESKSLRAWLEGFNGEKVSRENVMDQVKKNMPDIKEHWLSKPRQMAGLEDWLIREQNSSIEQFDKLPVNERVALQNKYDQFLENNEDDHRPLEFEDWLREKHHLDNNDFDNLSEQRKRALRDEHVSYEEARHRPLEFDDWLEAQHNITEESQYQDLNRHERQQLDTEYEEYARQKQGSHSTKFDEYTLPGGTNYREYVATLPGEKNAATETFIDQLNKKLKDHKLDPLDIGQLRALRGHNMDEFDGVVEQFHRMGVDISDIAVPYTKNAPSNNYSVPDGHAYGDADLDVNRLLHARVKDRVTADGSKSLFVEELQSDWHQAGRKHGYATQPEFKGTVRKATHADVSAFATTPAEMFSVGDWIHIDENGKFSDKYDHTLGDEQEARAFFTKQDNIINSFESVPDAPFKKDWHELGMKRMLQEAVDKNYDSLSWTTGEQQADRYSLAKHVDKLTWLPGDETLTGFKNGAKVFNRPVSAEELPSVIGKEAAEKLLQSQDAQREFEIVKNDSGLYDVVAKGDSPSKYINRNPIKSLNDAKKYVEYLKKDGFPPLHSIEGEDLKVGGEGMKGFYDKMLPNFMDKYLKKYGVKAEKVPIDIGDKNTSFVNEYGHPDTWIIKKISKAGYDNPYEVIGKNGTKLVDHFNTEDAAQQFINTSKEVHNNDLVKNKVWSVKITPEMRRDLAQGQPLTGNLTLRDLPKGKAAK